MYMKGYSIAKKASSEIGKERRRHAACVPMAP